MSILAHKAKYHVQTSNNDLVLHNSVKLTLLMLVVFFAISIGLSICLPIVQGSKSVLALLSLMLFSMTHLFNTYNNILQVRMIAGLTSSEQRRLSSTVKKRTSDIFKLMLIYLTCTCLITALSLLDVINFNLSIFFAISIIIASMVDSALAWRAVKEVKDVEFQIQMRLNKDKAYEKVKENAEKAKK